MNIMTLPEIIIPYHISLTYIQEHGNYIFLFGQDLDEKGMFGQAGVAYGMTNCFPIPTCRKMCRSNRYWSDNMYDEVVTYIDSAIAKIPRDSRPIIPFRKIGCGASQMNFLAPKLFAYMISEIDKIKYPNIKINYGA